VRPKAATGDAPCDGGARSEMSANHMTSRVEQRESPRYPHTAAIMFENYLSGNYYEGRMMNYSRGGMCFEADVTPVVGTEIFIGIEKSPYSSKHDVFRAKVVWFRELPLKESYYLYGVGVKFC
jgi:hypothetical protein